jgi:hypothetical protein
MTLAERIAFQQGFLAAFAICAKVQRQCFNHLGEGLDGLERGVERLEGRPRRLRVVRRLERAGIRDGRQLYWIA